MVPYERINANRARAESFGTLAEIYDAVRPGYPAELIDDLVAGGPLTALDIGCGTGKAARPLAERGVDVLGVEVDARMADVARRHGVRVEVTAFEDWDPRGRQFDLVVCGQAWHWIDPTVGPAKVNSLLRAGGLLAVFWNFGEVEAPARAALTDVYRDIAPDLAESSIVMGGQQERTSDLDPLATIGPIDHRTYRWRRIYQAGEWLALLRTHSDHATLAAAQLADLLEGIDAALTSVGEVVPVEYRTHALLVPTG